ncbi:MAG: hypothetical protein JJE13_07000 [Thermoleophilia bacterium]|nr:hypothetical protein [Thermoleophilia bacterium]
MLVLETEGALPPARRKRRRPKKSGRTDAVTHVSVTTATLIRAHEPLGSESGAAAWVARLDEDEFTQGLLDEALESIDRALAAEAAATGRPFAESPALEQIISARIGYGDGDRLADGRFLDAFDIDARGGTASPRRERRGRTRPIARIAAILSGKDEANACEFLVPRVRADLDAGRIYAAALAIETAVRATVVEMDAALDVPDHMSDLDHLERLLPELTELTDNALGEGRARAGLGKSLEEPLLIAERVIRRRRVLEQ